ncbi:unnamed protein product [Acanthoscelides obtectus]|uniref:PWWP domain-containing protein n=1 Tax=Acanthoscelides obtectus TaxID=200917 RepID=A0A9P0LAA1_ACAOB|nr:unnamed protein product [Acanthoscelides obtectus]CAK1658872.1 Putative oxidoreductase GLYR1 homolog [Acanthoscelides obtectus]
MEAVTPNLNLDEFVWAKVRGHPYWPGIVLSPGPRADLPEKPVSTTEENYFWIYFFGSRDYAWVPEKQVKSFRKHYSQYATHKRTRLFLNAVKEVETHMQIVESNPEYEIVIESFVKKKPRSKSQKRTRDHTDPLEEDRPTKHKEIWCDTLETGNIPVSQLKIGVIGIGNIGRGIAGKLVKTGHTVNVWNRTAQKSNALRKDLDHNIKLTIHDTPRSLLLNSDTIFICISDEDELKIFFQNNFNMHDPEEKTLQDKGMIIMTSMGPETAKDIKDMIERKGGRYLETLIQWSSLDNNRFILLAAGDEALFQSIQSCTKAFSTSSVFLGDAGYACVVYLVLQLIKGVCLAGLIEGFHLAERCGVTSVTDFREIFQDSLLCNNYLKAKVGHVVFIITA